MSASQISRSEFFAIIGRAVFRSRVTQVLIAVAVAAASIGLAAICWEARSVIIGFLGICLILFGFHFAWELLPFSEQTRARWARGRALSERYPSYRWRNMFSWGIASGAVQLWQAYAHQHLDPQHFVVPGVFILWGAIAHWIWHTRHADEHDESVSASIRPEEGVAGVSRSDSWMSIQRGRSDGRKTQLKR